MNQVQIFLMFKYEYKYIKGKHKTLKIWFKKVILFYLIYIWLIFNLIYF